MKVKTRKPIIWQIVPKTNVIKSTVIRWKERAVVAVGACLFIWAIWPFSRNTTPEPILVYPLKVVSVGQRWGETINNHDPIIVACFAEVKDASGRRETLSGLQYCSLKQGDVVE